MKRGGKWPDTVVTPYGPRKCRYCGVVKEPDEMCKKYGGRLVDTICRACKRERNHALAAGDVQRAYAWAPLWRVLKLPEVRP